MLQSLATLIFAAAAVSAMLMIAALITMEWPNVRVALGLVKRRGEGPLPPHIRALSARRVPMLQVMPAALKRAA